MNNFYILLILFIIPLVMFYVIRFLYTKGKDKKLSKRISGFEVARKILDENGLSKMYIVEIKTGDLTDHYDSKQKVIRLSTDVFHGESCYAAAVATYYAGLAVKDEKENNGLYKIKMLIDKIVEFIYILTGIIFIMWCFMQDSNTFILCLVLFAISLLYSFLVVPINMNNSNDCLRYLNKIDNFEDKEMDDIKKILGITSWVQCTNVIILLCKGIKNLIANMKAS